MVDSSAGHRRGPGSPPSEYAGRLLAGRYRALSPLAHRGPYESFPCSAYPQAREQRLHLILREILWTKRGCFPACTTAIDMSDWKPVKKTLKRREGFKFCWRRLRSFNDRIVSGAHLDRC